MNLLGYIRLDRSTKPGFLKEEIDSYVRGLGHVVAAWLEDDGGEFLSEALEQISSLKLDGIVVYTLNDIVLPSGTDRGRYLDQLSKDNAPALFSVVENIDRGMPAQFRKALGDNSL